MIGSREVQLKHTAIPHNQGRPFVDLNQSKLT